LEIRETDARQASGRIEGRERLGDCRQAERRSRIRQAKNRHLNEKKILEAGQLKYSTERVEQTIDFEPAKIWDKGGRLQLPGKAESRSVYAARRRSSALSSASGLAFFIEYLDTSVKTLDDVEKYLKIPVLAVVPRDVSTLIKTPGEAPDAGSVPDSSGER
jgi:hypothetical protein